MTAKEREATLEWLLLKITTGGVEMDGVSLPIQELIELIEKDVKAKQDPAPLTSLVRSGREKLTL